jgi:hypothetical protein
MKLSSQSNENASIVAFRFGRFVSGVSGFRFGLSFRAFVSGVRFDHGFCFVSIAAFRFGHFDAFERIETKAQILNF